MEKKKKKKKGFTLIELLAVIVILAIIALVVMPVVSNLIESARNAADARSVEGHIRNVEIAIVTDAFHNTHADLSVYNLDNEPFTKELTLPENDHITCSRYTILNGQITYASGCTDKTENSNWKNVYKFTLDKGAEIEVNSNE